MELKKLDNKLKVVKLKSDETVPEIVYKQDYESCDKIICFYSDNDSIERNYNNYKFIKLSNEQAIIVDNLNNYKVIETK